MDQGPRTGDQGGYLIMFWSTQELGPCDDWIKQVERREKGEGGWL